MKEGFETGLRQVSEAEKMRQGEIELMEGVNDIHAEIKERLGIMTMDQKIDEEKSEEVGKKILEIQRKKLKIMNRLQEELLTLDNDLSEEVEERNGVERRVRFDEVNKNFSYKTEKNEVRKATFGEILTDLDWEIEYDLGDTTIPKLYKKRYLVEKAKLELRELLDRQILITELNSSENDEKIRSTYQNIFDKNEARRKKGVDEGNVEQIGFVAERTVQNFLKQLSIDHNLPFSVKVADVQQDVELKMDFIVHKKHTGVGVEVDIGDDEDVAIQYSINQNKEKFKRKQIEKVERKLSENKMEIKHIALVVFPINDLNKISKEWKRQGKQAGGPSKLMSKEIKEKLFFTLLKDLFSEDEVRGFWDKVNQS